MRIVTKSSPSREQIIGWHEQDCLRRQQLKLGPVGWLGKFKTFPSPLVNRRKSLAPHWNRTTTAWSSSLWPRHYTDYTTIPVSDQTNCKTGGTSRRWLLCTRGSIPIALNSQTKMSHNISQQYSSIHSTATPAYLQHDTRGNKISRPLQPQAVSKRPFLWFKREGIHHNVLPLKSNVFFSCLYILFYMCPFSWDSLAWYLYILQILPTSALWFLYNATRTFR